MSDPRTSKALGELPSEQKTILAESKKRDLPGMCKRGALAHLQVRGEVRMGIHSIITMQRSEKGPEAAERLAASSFAHSAAHDGLAPLPKSRRRLAWPSAAIMPSIARTG